MVLYTGVPPGDMGKERQKEDRLEMLEPTDKRGKEVRRLRNAGRGSTEQGGHGGHPPHHKKRRGLRGRLPTECHPGNWQIRQRTAVGRIHGQDTDIVPVRHRYGTGDRERINRGKDDNSIKSVVPAS